MRSALPLVMIALLALSGCQSPYGLWPTREQQAFAQIHDPYPEPDIAHKIEGGRPREYEVPRSVPRRTQDERRWIDWPWAPR